MDRMEALVNTIIVERDGWKREALELRQDRADALRMVSRERERCTVILEWALAESARLNRERCGGVLVNEEWSPNDLLDLALPMINSGEWPPEDDDE